MLWDLKEKCCNCFWGVVILVLGCCSIYKVKVCYCGHGLQKPGGPVRQGNLFQGLLFIVRGLMLRAGLASRGH